MPRPLALLASAALLLSACDVQKVTQFVAPEPEKASMADGDQCFANRDLKCAEANYRGYVKKFPSDVRANAVLGITLSREGKHDEALAPLKKAIDAGAGTYDLFAAYAESLDAMGDLDGAIKWNRRTLEAVPSLVDVRGNLATQLARQGKVDEAIKLLKDFDEYLRKNGEAPYFTAQIAALEDKRAAAGGKGK